MGMYSVHKSVRPSELKQQFRHGGYSSSIHFSVKNYAFGYVT